MGSSLDLSNRISMNLLDSAHVGENPLAFLETEGVVTRNDFQDALALARKACHRRRRLCEKSHPLLRTAGAVSSTATVTPTSSVIRTSQGMVTQRSLFGVAAFAECLVKAAFWHLGRHGTPQQAR